MSPDQKDRLTERAAMAAMVVFFVLLAYTLTAIISGRWL